MQAFEIVVDEKCRRSAQLYCSANEVTHSFFDTQSEIKHQEMMREGSAFLYRLIVRNLTDSLHNRRGPGGKTAQGEKENAEDLDGHSMVDGHDEGQKHVHFDSAEVDPDIELMEAMEGVSYEKELDGLSSEDKKNERVGSPDCPT